MDFVQYAVPFFIIAMLLEFFYGKWRGRQTYRLNDTINSLSLGVISRLISVLRLSFAAVTFAAIVSLLNIKNWPMDSFWQWMAAFILYDFCYYWKHRYGHEWRLFWASHVAHHQSEEFNLSTALRQTGTDYIGFIFYIPLFLIGLPAEAVITVGSLNLIYQFWVHTEHVPKLGVLEWVFITPSNHRVHHARNPRYLDKNYGGVFILWDRLFGTFQEELAEEPCVYGITTGLHSWNPLWANVHVWWETLKISIATSRWSDKLAVWFKAPGWLPEDMTTPPPVNYRAEKFNADTQRWLKPYAFLHFWVVTGLAVTLQELDAVLSRGMALSGFVWLIYSLLVFGFLFEGRNNVLKLETIRLVSALLLSIWFFTAWYESTNAIVVTLVVIVLSLLYLWLPRRSELPAQPAK